MTVRDIGLASMHLGDCMEVMPRLGHFDAVVTDPPYGIGEHGGKARHRGRPGYSKHENRGWDKERPPREVFDAMLACSDAQVIWGGNYFADMLPASMGWLYWQKLMGGDFADGELTWTSRRMALREFSFCPKGMDKAHPCEKPVRLMKWCIGLLKLAGDPIILDPFAGLGSTGVAAVEMGMRFVGIERDPVYFEIACRRLEEAQRQERLFAGVMT